MSKGISAQKPFKMLVANLRGASDPSKGESGNPQKVRSTYTTQNILEVPQKGIAKSPKDGKTPGIGTRMGHIVQGSVAPTLTISVDNAATVSTIAPTLIILGDYQIESHVDFTVVTGDTTATATNLATYIDTNTLYSATSALEIVTVSLPTSIEYNNMLTEITGPNSGDYTISIVTKGEPYVGPAIIG